MGIETCTGRDVTIPTIDGLKLAGRMHPAASKGPGIVLVPGFACVKEMLVPEVAEAFARAGVTALTIDPRNTGASDGHPRQEIDPRRQVEDVSDALTFLRQQPIVDPDQVGIWGFSFGASVALNAAALDRRAKGVIAVCPLTDFSFGGKKAKVLAKAFRDRESQLQGNEPFCLPVLTEQGENPAGFGVGTAREDFGLILGAEKYAPTYRNLTTLQTYYHISNWDPYHLISPAARQREVFDLVAGTKMQHVEPNKGHMDILSGDTLPKLMQLQIDYAKSHFVS